ncbi:hypothetical protein NC653_022524 [Populus alba x Populus x berolinensis]|uniref:Uncharacterized protein n=1 Tax=Populus alba x Populus x berolinensis TaxID=444605 RepID=A0AAD6MFE0_9ROSI|nr:hypothetical protein NC653_022524 [Populus alba x Populus x berolinensis]
MGDLRKLVVGIRMSDDNAQMVPPPRRQARGIISILFEHEQATQQVSMIQAVLGTRVPGEWNWHRTPIEE